MNRTVHSMTPVLALIFAWVVAAPLGAQTLPPPPTSPAPVTQFAYDAQGNVTLIRQAGNATTRTYDSLSRLRGIQDARAAMGQLDYNGGGNDMVRFTDPRNLVTQLPRDGMGQIVQLSSPDTGTALQTYDAVGNLLTRTDSRGVLASYGYDALDRLKSAIYTQGAQIESFFWNYDQTGAGFSNGIGRLTSAQFPGGASTYRYDPWGRLIGATQTVSVGAAVPLHVGYGYDAAGHVTSVTYPSGRVILIPHTGGDPTGLSVQPSAGSAALPLLSALQFEPAPGGTGDLRSWNWEMNSGTMEHHRVFDVYGRMVRYPLGGAVRDLTYDVADRIAGFTHLDAVTGQATVATQALNQAFGYDEVGRLTNVTTPTQVSSYGYDDNGNRTQFNFSAGSAGASRPYTVDSASNRLLNIASPTRSFSHDDAGNVTSSLEDRIGWTATHDLSGRIKTLVPVQPDKKSLRQWQYLYDASGLRVAKFLSTGRGANAINAIYMYGQYGELLGEYSASTGEVLREYVWLRGIPLVVIDGSAVSPVVYYVQTDHINTPRVMLDRSGRQRWSWVAEPFGNGAPVEDPIGFRSVKLNLRMPGQYFDEESGLSYNWHRFYDAGVGRYTQSDPIGLAGGINTYTYAAGNPIINIDPTGLDAMVCQYRGAGGFGHVGIGINSTTTSGFYPQSKALGNPVTGTPGIVTRDTGSARQCKAISTTPEQDRLMSEYMRMASQGAPSDYALLTNNCTNFVRDVLLQSGLVIPATSPRPGLFFQALPGTPTGP